jgi:hypothetical protein
MAENKMMQRFIILLLLIAASFFSEASSPMHSIDVSQNKNIFLRSNETSSSPSESKTVFNHDTWKEKSKDYKFNPPRSINQPSKGNSNWDFSWLKGPGKIFLYIILFAILGIIIYYLIRLALTPGNKKIKSVDEIDLSIHDEPGIESDLEKLLSEALSAKNYKAAIRIYYLLGLRTLSEQNLITPAREKTNFEYLAELGNHPAFSLFREMTVAFERSWFGEGVTDESSLSDYAGKYDRLKSSVLSSLNSPKS